MRYWLLTGRLVFEGLTDYETLLEHVNTLPVPPSQRTETAIPSELDRIIMACLDKDPSKRPQTASELIATHQRDTAGKPLESNIAPNSGGGLTGRRRTSL